MVENDEFWTFDTLLTHQIRNEQPTRTSLKELSFISNLVNKSIWTIKVPLTTLTILTTKADYSLEMLDWEGVFKFAAYKTNWRIKGVTVTPFTNKFSSILKKWYIPTSIVRVDLCCFLSAADKWMIREGLKPSTQWFVVLNSCFLEFF